MALVVKRSCIIGFRTCVFPIIDFDNVKYRSENLYLMEKSVGNLEMKLSKDFDLSISFKYQILSLFYETKGILKELDMIKSKFN